jgi:hypothetical protein
MTYLPVPGVGTYHRSPSANAIQVNVCLRTRAKSGDQNLSGAVTETQLIPLRQPPR